jgi:hypothetical protein
MSPASAASSSIWRELLIDRAEDRTLRAVLGMLLSTMEP